MHRGLRQSDSLTPLLFLIIVESLNTLFSVFMEANRFKGFEVGSNEFRVSIRAVKVNFYFFIFMV